MSEIKETVIAMLRAPQLSSMATITLDGKPWTRYIMIQSDDEFNLRSAVGLQSRKIRQIEKNPEVHLCFGINGPQDLDKPYVQIQGTAKITTAEKEKQNYWFDMLSSVFSGPDDPNYAVMIIKPYRVEFNNPGVMMPEIWER